jgi:phosphoesterase RecJ-like protein
LREELLQAASGKKKIAIAGHVRPDGDCVGSCLGAYHFLKKHFPEAEVQVFLEEIPHIFEFLKDWELIKRPGDSDEIYDLFLVLDCGDLSRIGDSASVFSKAKSTMCIDHHLSNGAFCDVNVVEADASSTCELVFDQIPKDELDKTIAECLYTGMVTDTGVFQYSCTHHSTMDAAGTLMDLGIDYPGIVDRVFNEKTFEANRVLGHVLLKARRNASGSVISAVLTREEMNQFGVSPKHLEGIVQQLRATKGVEVAIFLYETESGEFKGSTRAKGDIVNLVPVAQMYGGGGHMKAAGFTYKGDPEVCIHEVTNLVEEQIRLKG